MPPLDHGAGSGVGAGHWYDRGVPTQNHTLNPAFQLPYPEMEVRYVPQKQLKSAPAGFRWISCRYRKVRGPSQRKLDAHAYGYKAWRFLVPAK